MINLGVLGSGKGSNFQAIHEAITQEKLCARITLVLSDKAEAPILDRAARFGVPHVYVDCSGYRSLFPLALQSKAVSLLQDAQVDVVCLAGFMRLLKAPLLEAFPGRVLNIHPSFLPSFPGLRAWEQAINAQAKFTGVTVHYVDEGVDSGSIILQEKLDILQGERPEELHARLQELEHRLYPEAIALVLEKVYRK